MTGKSYIYTPYTYLGPAQFKAETDALILGATPANMGKSVVEKIVRDGIKAQDEEPQ